MEASARPQPRVGAFAWPDARTALVALLVGVLGYAGSHFASVVRFPEVGTAILFPPYAVLGTALLLSPRREWWIYALASAVGHSLASSPDFPLTWTLGASVANVTRSLVVAEGVRRFGGPRPYLESVRGMTVFLVVAALIAPALAAFGGVAVNVAHGSAAEPVHVWNAWFLSNALTALTLFPVVLALGERAVRRAAPPDPRRLLEGVLLAAGILGVGVTALTGGSTRPTELAIRLSAPLPFVMWAAVRFGPAGASASLLAVTLIAMWGLLHGTGPFAGVPSDQSVLELYVFIAIRSAPFLLLAAALCERERTRAALRERDARIALAATSANLGFWDWDVRADALWVSDEVRRLYRLRSDEEVTPGQMTALLHPEDADDVLAARQRTLEQGVPFEVEFRAVLADGTTRWMAARGELERGADGSPARVTGIVIDATDRKSAEREAADRRLELTHLGRVVMVGELSGALAHELRQPLTAIQMNARAAQRLLGTAPVDAAPDATELREIIEDILRDDARASEVVARYRALLRRDDGCFEPLRLEQLVRDVLGIARADLAARGVDVAVTETEDIPGVNGDRMQLQQLVLNLVLNACDAMRETPAGVRHVAIAVARDGALDGRPAVRLTVRDRGPGIAASELERVFEPFVTSKPDGLGLGLAICRSIATLHGGQLWATNDEGGGASLELTLPGSAGE